MRAIKKYVDRINEEIEDAKNYAEKYVEYKAKNDMYRANKYREISNNELEHAMIIHEFAVKEVENISKVFTPPVDMLEKWEHAHRKYIEEVAMVKQMLSL